MKRLSNLPPASVCRGLVLAVTMMASTVSWSETDFPRMLEAARHGDDMARVVIAYSYLWGEYRDGTPVEKDLDLAYAWASLANFQGNERAQSVLDRVIPQLEDRERADALAVELHERYDARSR